jgi:hypothetical protein
MSNNHARKIYHKSQPAASHRTCANDTTAPGKREMQLRRLKKPVHSLEQLSDIGELQCLSQFCSRSGEEHGESSQ